ncbi:GNAT family N-acetyltransferase [Dyella tabacisoli]|uniref:N-acetyltransferase n=1 Tax=Dyella tabacisoli TaxID=2282381 RepID=A0A369UY31_9GAMM|nr:GNAT family N-acetyltransferase [Dyella tabacisoli]RDD83249.1 N-acetyltransferase [Dyella tabacisoli]
MLLPRIHNHINDLPATAWDALRPDDNPFLSHRFLAALESTGCIRADWGWQAHHLGLYEHDTLVAATPLYLKGNSHGEFVFDWSWASAWERAGGDYYPKLLNAVPYSPVPGTRLLVGDGAQASRYRRALVIAMQAQVEQLGLSSAHANFLSEDDLPAFGDDWLTRSDIQFHWTNRSYGDFADFLAALSHKKRKNIRHERAHVAQRGLHIEMRGGDTLSRAEWQRVHALYASTFDAKGNHAALTQAFFIELGQSFGDAVQLALAHDRGEIIAMALSLQSSKTLYGRYWGASVEIPGLHFELCYYQGIEHAIRHGLQRFEPGAQGEHKMARGFLPVRTHSRHYLADEGFRAAVRQALTREALSIDEYADELLTHSPYAER